MTRPTVLDMDLVVVPREATVEMECRVDHEDCTTPDAAKSAYSAMLVASPYPTAWDDVRKYVEGLERERDEATGTLRYCEKQWSDERGVMIDKFVYERNRAEAAEARAEAAERQLSEIAGHMDSECDSDSILHGIREAEADRTIYKDRATSAEAEAARLRALLAEAREVVEPFAKVKTADGYPDGFLRIPDEHGMLFNATDALGETTNWEPVVLIGHLRAARALAEKLEKEISNE